MQTREQLCFDRDGECIKKYFNGDTSRYSVLWWLNHKCLPYLSISISTVSTHTSENSFLMATKKIPDSNSAVIRACSKFIIRGWETVTWRHTAGERSQHLTDHPCFSDREKQKHCCIINRRRMYPVKKPLKRMESANICISSKDFKRIGGFLYSFPSIFRTSQCITSPIITCAPFSIFPVPTNHGELP